MHNSKQQLKRCPNADLFTIVIAPVDGSIPPMLELLCHVMDTDCRMTIPTLGMDSGSSIVQLYPPTSLQEIEQQKAQAQIDEMIKQNTKPSKKKKKLTKYEISLCNFGLS